MPDGQVRSQEELHNGRTRRPKNPIWEGMRKVGVIWPSASCSVLRESPRRPLRANKWSPPKNVEIFDLSFFMEYPCLGITKIFCRLSGKDKIYRRLRCFRRKCPCGDLNGEAPLIVARRTPLVVALLALVSFFASPLPDGRDWF